MPRDSDTLLLIFAFPAAPKLGPSPVPKPILSNADTREKKTVIEDT